MRLTRFRLFLLFGASLLLLGPAIGLGQPGGPPGDQQGGDQQGGRQGRRGRMGGPQGADQQGGPPGGFQGGQQGGPPGGRQGGRQFDPNMIFNMISQGKDYIVVADWLPMASARDPNAKDRIDSFMQRMGITNGQLTRDQFSQFMQERMAQRQAERAAANPNNGQSSDQSSTSSDATTEDGGPAPPEDTRPVVYRAGNLPPGLPSWFAGMDIDRDGQVGLYEWKAAGGSVSDFQNMDLNGDGFITVEEALRYQKSQGTAVASTGPSLGAPSFGSPNGQGFNPQGFNGQGPNGQGNRGGNRRRGNFQGGQQGPPGQQGFGRPGR